MRLLLDTHAFLWWLGNHPLLTTAAKDAIRAPGSVTYVSAATAWEITTKYRLGKLPGVALVAADVAAQVAAEGFGELPVTVEHGQHAGALAGSHKDPFDRMLIAQALLEDLALVSNEALFDAYGVRRVW